MKLLKSTPGYQITYTLLQNGVVEVFNKKTKMAQYMSFEQYLKNVENIGA